MHITDVFRVSWQSLRSSSTRSILTALGVAIGTGATILVSILGIAVREALDQQLEKVGKTMILIRPGSTLISGHTLSSPLTLQDVEFLRQDPQLKLLTKGFAEAQSSPLFVSYGSRRAFTTVEGVKPDVFAIRHWQLQAGRFLTASDLSNRNKVCVLGSTVRKALFPSQTTQSVLNKKVIISGTSFTVVGLLQTRGRDPLGRDHDDECFIPLTLSVENFFHSSNVSVVVGDARREADIDPSVQRITKILKDRRKVKDFEVSSLKEMAEFGLVLTETLNLLTAVLASISIAVGGIGVAATLLATVVDKTREIGLRTALGATPGDIGLQMMSEALLLAGSGGVAGVVLGLVSAYFLTSALSWPYEISGNYVLAGLTIVCFIGVLAGVYPSWVAARMQPIEAIRSE